LDALILAAGLGSRLRPITDSIPKAMVQYDGREIIYHQLTNLLDHEFKKIIVVSGYKSEILRSFLEKEFNTERITIVENEQYDTSNSAFSFFEAHKELVSNSYIHLNCDILFSKSLLKRIIDSRYENILAARSDMKLGDRMENIILKKNRIVNMCLKNSSESSHKGFGLAKISKKAVEENIKQYLRLNDEIKRVENYYGLIRMSLGNVNYYIEESAKYELAEINTHNDLESCKFVKEC
tara:strand:+ start:580 stop:1293 length:714 start_codon:yes stop_codon:yes gene_type:complete